MFRRFLRTVLVLTIIIMSLAPTALALADSTAADCAEGQWVLEPGQTLGTVAYICGTSVPALIAANGIHNPNLVDVGQMLVVPTPGGRSNPPTAVLTVPTAPSPLSTEGDVSVTWGEPLYAADGRAADFPVTVTNVSIAPAIAGGRYSLGRSLSAPDVQEVTLRAAIHDVLPYPAVEPTDLLWKATVTLDDGLIVPAYVGCKYLETIYAQADEPLDRSAGAWFHWEVTLPGGWFDCGSAYQVKPEDIPPGQSGSSILTVYLVHPRESAASIARRVAHIDLEVFTTEGQPLGIVSSQDFR